MVLANIFFSGFSRSFSGLEIDKRCVGFLFSMLILSSWTALVSQTVIRSVSKLLLRRRKTANICDRPVRLAVKGFFTREGGPGLGPLCGNDTILRFPLSVSHVSIDDVSRLALFEPFALICDA